MASGRVGGTKSMKSGQVGDEIYQIVKNADGTYSQVVYGKPEQVVQAITPRLQAQRMCTCMVEALMRDLKPVGRISWQSAANKSKSLNAMSSYNLQLVARDCKTNWYSNNQYLYPWRFYKDSTVEKLGGPYMISAGTGTFDVFDEVNIWPRPWQIWPYAQFFGHELAAVRFSLQNCGGTVGGFLKRHRMTRLDQVIFCFFHQWHEWNPDEESYDPYTGTSYIIASINPAVADEAPLDAGTIENLFVLESNIEPFKKESDNGQDFYFGLLYDIGDRDERVYFYNAFTISWADGKKKITTKSLKPVPNVDTMYLQGHAPADVLGSWMGDPSIKPWPSPFI